MDILYRVLKKENYNWNNLFNNFVFLLSAAASYMLLLRFHLPYLLSSFTAVLAAVLVSASSDNLWVEVRAKRKQVQIWALLTAIAMVPANTAYFLDRLFSSEKLLSLVNQFLPGGADKALLFGCLLAICASYFWFLILCYIIEWLWNMLTEVFKDCSKTELQVAGCIVIILCVFATWVFFQTNTFCYSVVYGADSDIVFSNVYLALPHAENDIRQPLFALFSSPFTGIPYLVSLLIPGIKDVTVLFMMLCQIPVLVLSSMIFTNLAARTERYRCVLLVIFSSTYMNLLFSVMLEQYIVCVFWLSLLVYTFVEKKEESQTALLGAAGSIVVSSAFVFFLDFGKKFKLTDFLKKFLETALLGGLLVALPGRMDAVFAAPERMELLGSFMGGDLTLGDKILQYINFVAGCFWTPKAGMHINEYIIWGLDEVVAINISGVFLLCFAVIGFAVNYKDCLAKICLFWIAVSVGVIVVAGWGAAENCSILYALYFGWAFVILIWKFWLFILHKIHLDSMICVTGGFISLILLYINFNGILDIVRFGIIYYPK